MMAGINNKNGEFNTNYGKKISKCGSKLPQLLHDAPKKSKICALRKDEGKEWYCEPDSSGECPLIRKFW